MKKREWLLVFIPLLVVLILDQITKQWASQLLHPIRLGSLKFILHHNPGAMLGLFADLPPVLRVVSLSTGGGFLVCTYGFIQYLLPIKSLILRSGLSILLGGILGNVLDRILYGHVIDFIAFDFGSFHSPVFNVADALQWVGYAMIVYAVVKEGDLLWPENNLRKGGWINTKFQLKYCFILLGVGLGIGLISAIFSYTYLRVSILELVGPNQIVLDRFLEPFIITFTSIIAASCLGLFTVGKLVSHRAAGPVYAFGKYIEDLLKDKPRTFKLRAKDDFKELEVLAQQLNHYILEQKQKNMKPENDPKET